MKKIISGSGGGGGGKGGGGSSRVPVEAPDSLQSRAFVKVLDLVGEGEIEGLVNGYKSIFFDGTPLQNQDGTFNFNGVEVSMRLGSQDQEYIENFNTTETETPLGVEFTESAPVIRSFSNEAIDAVAVRISFPQLTFQDPKKGDLKGTEVSYKIELQSNGAGYEEVLTDTIIGKSTSKYERRYRVDLTGDPPWDIRVSRITPDAPQVNTQNKSFVESMTEIVDGKFRYPNSAVVGIKIDSAQFSSVPTRGYDLKLLRVKIPSNYDPVARTYNGVWDGTFYIAWTDNPAWIYYDILTNERYGLGAFIPEEQIDKWALYEIAQYCDELVSDGRDGLEPRFTCNAYLQDTQDAYTVLKDLASCFRGMIYWAGGSIITVQDAPRDATHLFTAANVVEGKFNYAGSSAKTRHTVALVTWNDPDDLFRQKIEYVEDAAAIARYGIIETQVVAFGCTSQGQAQRAGRWILFTEQGQTETVNFNTGINGTICRPGDIIKVADPTRSGPRRAGRIKNATTTAITLDDTSSFNPATHTVSVVMPDGTIEERQVSTANAGMITVAVPFSVAPQKGAIWMVASSTIEPQLFKIVSIGETGGGIYEITALAHSDQKYDLIEEGVKLEPRSISGLSTIPGSPSNLTLTETLYEVSGDVRVKVTISWNPPQGASSYVVSYYRDQGNPITLPSTSSNDIEILNAEPGVYFASVVAVSPIGIRSVPATATKTIRGKAAPPNDVQGFSLLPLAGVAYLSWNPAIDLDVLIGGAIRIRHTPNVLDAVWRNAVDITPALSGNATRAQVPLMPGTYMAKFVDSSGIASDVEAKISTTVPVPLTLNVVETINEDPGFLGVRTDMAYFPDYEGLALEAAALVDDVLDVDAVVSWDFAGGVGTEGTYDFANIVDLEQVFSSRVTARILAESVDVTDTIDQREDLVDDWVDLDGDFIDTVNAELFMMTTEDDPNDMGAVWTEWRRFFVAEYKARGFKFQLRVTSELSNHNMIIKELQVIIDMPDRTFNLYGQVSSGSGTTTITYDGDFAQPPAVGITAYNMNSGDYYRITSENEGSFALAFYDSTDAIVSRTFDVLAKGYGRQL